MIPYNEMISLINIIYGQQNTGQQTPVQTMPVQTMPVQQTSVQTMPVQQTPVQTMPVQQTSVQTMPVQQTPVQTMPVQQTPVQTMAAYTPVLPLQSEAIKAENDVLKDVIATLQRNAMAQPISGYSPETSDTILSNLINPPIPAK